ncbi:MAG: Rieske (2Fe-2S) protein [Actinobacteria bacterium]|nr:MAG: Rieske (2Fe-2S) protein [Actinomycetota bacterium]
MSRRSGASRGYVGAIAGAFALSAAASVGLTVLYALGGQPQIEGGLIGVGLGSLALGFVWWGKHIPPAGPFVEEREPMASPTVERQTFEEDFARTEAAIPRRRFLGRMLLVALGALAAAAVFPIRSLGPKPGRSLFQTAWRRGSRLVTSEGAPVAATNLPVGGVLTVFPEGHTGAADSQTILVRVDLSTFQPLPGRESWSPDGYLAYSKICTHAGCPVGLYEQSSNSLFCPCHQSVFDVLEGAKPIGGPATRPLPQLPLEVGTDGFLRAQDDYSEPVGPGFWNEGP